MHIAINHRNGIPYACVMNSVRDGESVKKVLVAYLGRVLDADKGIYKSRDRGVFTYDLKTQAYGKPPSSFVPNTKRKNAREELIVDFGDAFLLNSLIDHYGLNAALDAIGYGNPDSLRALLLYYMLEKRSNAHAQTWWEGSYARILYPQANLSSQRISDLLSAIGDEGSLRAFFSCYLKLLGSDVSNDANILIDSTGMPNSIRFPLTAVSNHNGVISEEVRLIYVVQQGSRLPIYMRYVPGNIIDSTTLTTTVKELKAMGVNTKFAILDAGYVTEEAVTSLCAEKISFITRCPVNRTVYRNLMEKELDDLERDEYLAVDSRGRLYNGRQVYVKCVEVNFAGQKLYAYVARDKTMQEVERKQFIRHNLDEQAHRVGIQAKTREFGVFVLLSSRRIKAELVLEHYYVRQDVEQVFDISKNYASLLPLNVEKEETFRGHLLLTFIATIILQKLQNNIKKSQFSLDRILMSMRTQKAKIFENVVIPAEPTKEHNAIYKLLNVKPAKEYTRTPARV